MVLVQEIPSSESPEIIFKKLVLSQPNVRRVKTGVRCLGPRVRHHTARSLVDRAVAGVVPRSG
jgi:hypothetical protein